jgi:hypothetical protein
MGDFMKTAVLIGAGVATGGASLAVGGAAAGTAAAATAGATAATGSFLGLSSAAWAGISTAGTMLMSVQAGNAQKSNYAQQAQQEEFAAKDREVSRRKRLIASLSSQNAARGASGVRAFEGSPAAMMKNDIKEFNYDQSMAAANTSMKTSSLLESGNYAQQSGYTSAGNSLLTFGSRMAERG